MLKRARLDVIRAITEAVEHINSDKHDPQAAHERVKAMYSWEDIAAQVEGVYFQAMVKPHPDYLARFRMYDRCGAVFGKIMCMVVAIDWLFLWLLEYFWPASGIDVVPTFNRERFEKVSRSQGRRKKLNRLQILSDVDTKTSPRA
jgi:phosphatidylinositol glycan class A protein